MKRFVLGIGLFSLVAVCCIVLVSCRVSREEQAVKETEETAAAPEGETEVGPKPKLLAGKYGSSSEWGSGWLDLATTTNFMRGDRLRLTIGGTADTILVRLLPKGKSPGSSVGIVAGAITVPENRIVEVVLDTDRKGIIQISVHGGPKPWGKFPLGGGNGAATLETAELIRL